VSATTTGLVDRGVFSQFDPKISVAVPRHIGRQGNAIHIDKKRRVLVLLHRGAAVKAYPVRFGFNPRGDKVRQGDGRTPEGCYTICEALQKNLAKRYGARSLRISYPNNAGFDLQQLMHRHIKGHRRLYRWIRRPDRNIDHRRVRSMVTYFRSRFRLLATSVQRSTRLTLLPGDIVFMDTLPKPGPDHVGIISDRLGKSGFPLVINNWTHGYHTSEMDLLSTIPVTHHFRLLPRKKGGPASP